MLDADELLDELALDRLCELSLEYSSGVSRFQPSHQRRPRKAALTGNMPTSALLH